MHVDWRWIKQRPHFLAEELSKDYDVLVLYRPNLRRLTLPRNASSVHRLAFLPIPRSHDRVARALDQMCQRMWLTLIGWLFKPDIVWLTFPTLHRYLPFSLRSKPIVYDCMDDAVGFTADRREAERIVATERRVVQAAGLILCTSQYLLNRITERYRSSIVRPPVLIRNAISRELLEDVARRFDYHRPRHKSRTATSSPYKVAYVGTVGNWVDLDSLTHCVELLGDVQFELVGPVLLRHRLAVERIVYHGAVEHSGLLTHVERFDAFIMPFVLNDLTRGVDPVKLYEYLAFGKEVVSVFYDELKRFAPFVHFYTSWNELVAILRSLIDETAIRKNTREKTLPFLQENTWVSRASDIKQWGLEAMIAGPR